MPAFGPRVAAVIPIAIAVVAMRDRNTMWLVTFGLTVAFELSVVVQVIVIPSCAYTVASGALCY